MGFVRSLNGVVVGPFSLSASEGGPTVGMARLKSHPLMHITTEP